MNDNRQPQTSEPTPEYGAPTLPVYASPDRKTVHTWGLWECGTCGRHNDLHRIECRVCHHPRPDEETA